MDLGEGEEEAFPPVEGEEVVGGVGVKEAAVEEEVGVVPVEGAEEEEGREVGAGEAVAVVLVAEEEEEGENHLLGMHN